MDLFRHRGYLKASPCGGETRSPVLTGGWPQELRSLQLRVCCPVSCLLSALAVFSVGAAAAPPGAQTCPLLAHSAALNSVTDLPHSFHPNVSQTCGFPSFSIACDLVASHLDFRSSLLVGLQSCHSPQLCFFLFVV